MKLTKKEQAELRSFITDIYVDVDMKAVQYLGAFTKEEKDITEGLRENLKALREYLGLITKQTETPVRVSERRALADEVRDQVRGQVWLERVTLVQLQI